MAQKAASTVQANAEAGEFFPVPLATLRLDTTTSFDIYLLPAPGQPFVLYCERNADFTDEVRRRLIANKVDRVYVRKFDRTVFRRYVENNLSAIVADESIPLEEKADIVYSTTSGVLESLLTNPESPQEVGRSKQLVRHAVDFMLADKQVFGQLLKTLPLEYKLYTHSVNVLTYSLSLAMRAGYGDPATLRELAVGALLHDVGKTRIDPVILDHPGPLSAEQWDEMRRHPAYGHEILCSAGNVGEIALDIVLHHHEKTRGGGYPDGLKGKSISPFVRIVSVCDVFDALTTDRPFQKLRNSFSALSVMRAQVASDLDPDFFRLLVAMMGKPVP